MTHTTASTPATYTREQAIADGLFSLGGAALRASTHANAAAELARRAGGTTKPTVAQLRSWGRSTEADAIVAHAKADKAAAKVAPKPAKAAAPAPAPVVQKPKAVAFTRTNERVDVLTERVANIEGSILALAASQASMKSALDLVVAKLTA